MTDREFQVWLAVYMHSLTVDGPDDDGNLSQKYAAKEANQAVWELRAAEATLTRAECSHGVSLTEHCEECAQYPGDKREGGIMFVDGFDTSTIDPREAFISSGIDLTINSGGCVHPGVFCGEVCPSCGAAVPVGSGVHERP